MRAGPRFLVVIVAVGCGRVGYDQTSQGRLDAANDARDEDADIMPLGAFDAPSIIPALADPSFDDDPCMTADLLELYFEGNRPGGPGQSDIYVSKRDSPSAPWGTPELVTELSTSFDESTPSVAGDGLTMWFVNNSGAGLGGDDIWVSTRANRSSTWGAPVLDPELNSTDDESGPATTADQLTMFFESDRLSPGAKDIFLTTRPTTSAPWTTPVPIESLNTEYTDSGAQPLSGGLVVVFGSRRLTAEGPGDLFRSFRSSIDQPFDAPTEIPGLNTSFDEQDPWLSPDRRYIVFASNRSGNMELYEASR